MAVLIVVVAFRGEKTIEATIERALNSNVGADVLVIDNASDDNTPQILRSIKHPRIRLIRNDRNLGVGTALNQGLRQAREYGADWMMVLDQDSLLTFDTLQKLLDAANMLLHRSCRPLSALFPTVRCKSFPDVHHDPMNWTGSGFKNVVPSEAQGTGTLWIPVDTSISSGALYRREALEANGGFNEGYFIDFVDHECHLRLRRAGYGLWWVRDAEIFHELGAIQKMTDTGLWIEHAPFRYYYMARNMVRGYWAFGGIRALWGLWREIQSHILRMRRYGENAAACEHYLMFGIRDGLLGRTGPLPAAL